MSQLRIAQFVGGPYDGQRREIPRSQGERTWSDPTVVGTRFGGHYQRTNTRTEDNKAVLWTWKPLP